MEPNRFRRYVAYSWRPSLMSKSCNVIKLSWRCFTLCLKQFSWSSIRSGSSKVRQDAWVFIKIVAYSYSSIWTHFMLSWKIVVFQALQRRFRMRSTYLIKQNIKINRVVQFHGQHNNWIQVIKWKAFQNLPRNTSDLYTSSTSSTLIVGWIY